MFMQSYLQFKARIALLKSSPLFTFLMFPRPLLVFPAGINVFIWSSVQEEIKKESDLTQPKISCG